MLTISHGQTRSIYFAFVLLADMDIANLCDRSLIFLQSVHRHPNEINILALRRAEDEYYFTGLSQNKGVERLREAAAMPWPTYNALKVRNRGEVQHTVSMLFSPPEVLVT